MLRCSEKVENIHKKILVIKCHPYFKLIWKHWHDKCLWSVWKRYGFYDQRKLFYAVPKKTCFIRWNYGYFHHLHQWQQAAIKKGLYIFFPSHPQRLHKPCNMQMFSKILLFHSFDTNIYHIWTIFLLNGVPFISEWMRGKHEKIEWFGRASWEGKCALHERNNLKVSLPACQKRS